MQPCSYIFHGNDQRPRVVNVSPHAFSLAVKCLCSNKHQDPLKHVCPPCPALFLLRPVELHKVLQRACSCFEVKLWEKLTAVSHGVHGTALSTGLRELAAGQHHGASQDSAAAAAITDQIRLCTSFETFEKWRARVPLTTLIDLTFKTSKSGARRALTDTRIRIHLHG